VCIRYRCDGVHVWLVIFAGIVLSNEGGALREFKKPIRFGVATIFGKGSQIVSWIHINDLCRMILYAIENDLLNGVYNAVSPKPVTNKELVTKLARHMRGRFFIPIHIPEWVLKAMLRRNEY
jgi:Predicted nucleoside-diphosphate sugar epimerase